MLSLIQLKLVCQYQATSTTNDIVDQTRHIPKYALIPISNFSNTKNHTILLPNRENNRIGKSKPLPF